MSELEELLKKRDALSAEKERLSDEIKALDTQIKPLQVKAYEIALNAIGLSREVTYWLKPEYAEWYATEIQQGGIAFKLTDPVEVLYIESSGLVRIEQREGRYACVTGVTLPEHLVCEPA